MSKVCRKDNRLEGSEGNGASETNYFFGKKNKHQKYFITSNENYFGGIKVEWVTIDTGCSSLLLPLKPEQLSSLASSFPHPTFSWSIGGSIEVGSLNAVTLIVKRPGHTFDCSLNSSSILPIPFLRFHLCLEDVKWLEQNCTWLDNNSCPYSALIPLLLKNCKSGRTQPKKLRILVLNVERGEHRLF
eukprot:TRINITY_DN7064_c0_g1_i12.p1 TRINITY_DN7064_c0_g1~~TRINITY_DN7064_c0_g1_i12.p1  ORF type:complete len:187 (-),score=22.20 TRINITY_DN7064_c0_g1_i12:322-882(-)